MAKTHEELKQIAKDIHEGKIFTQYHMTPDQWGSMLPHVFLPIAFGALQELLKQAPVGMLYEYYEKSLPRGHNGFPIFQSFQYLGVEDTNAVIDQVESLKEIAEQPVH